MPLRCTQIEHSLLTALAALVDGSNARTQISGEPSLRTAQPSRDQVNAYHLARLQTALTYATERGSFYRGKREEATDVWWRPASLRDIARVPFTEPNDIAADPYAFACVSQAAIARPVTFTSSGTTGPQKRVFFSDADLESMTDFMATGIHSVAEPGDVVQILLPAGPPNSQADLLAKGVRKMGGKAVVTGTAPTDVQLEAIKQSHPGVLFGSTSRIFRLTKEAERECRLAGLGVRTLFVTSEYLAPAMRDALREAWGAEVVSHYGMTEMGLGVAVECAEGDGYHFNELDLLCEIVDPETGAVVEDGREGELVFTTLRREAMPLLRYRTHDIAQVVTTPCRCGATILKKFSPIIKRRGSVVRMGGYELYPALLDDALYRLPEIIDWRAKLVETDKPKTLHIQLEMVEGKKLEKRAVVNALLQIDAIRAGFDAGTIWLEVELLPVGSLIRTSRAKKLISQVMSAVAF